MPRRRVIALCLFALAVSLIRIASLYAEDVPAAPNPATAETPSPAAETTPDLQRDSLLIEISTATFYELATRARELGISDSGNADELRARLYEHFGLKAPATQAKGRTVTIERAGEASFAKVEDEEGGIIRASGGVILSLVETNGDSHRIKASSIAYDRAHSTLTARGSVSYERKSGSTTEVFSGEALSANLDDWSGVFIDGKVRRSNGAAASGERGLVVSADTILRRSAEVMVLKDGVISSCDAEDPHYSVKAGRVWFLGDKEWAVSDALFSLGNVPLLWLPFFYYPGDEIAFHPVLGYRSREGRFVQTTYYWIGAKPAPTTSTSILSFKENGPAKPTELKGLFLRRVLGPAPKDKGTLKTMLDLYSGLGGFIGVQASLPEVAFLDKTDFFAGLGVSRSLFLLGSGAYSPYVEEGSWSSVWNKSDFFGLNLPFRYGFDLSTSLRSGDFTASLALPIYSDSYFDKDFRNRSEDMDWLSLLSSKTDTSTAPSQRTTLTPALSTTLSLKPKGLGPWLGSIDITKLSTSMTILSKATTAAKLSESNSLFSVDTRRTFYYPSVYRPFDFSASLKGNLFGEGAKEAAPKAGEAPGTKNSEEALALRSPWEEETGSEGDTSPSAEGEPENSPASTAVADSTAAFRLPAAAPNPPSVANKSWAGSANWSLSPSLSYEDDYKSSSWTVPEEIDYSRLFGLMSYRLSASLDTSASYGNAVTSSLGLSFQDQGQKRSDIDSSVAGTYTNADKLAKIRRVGENAKFTVKPFTSWLWSNSSLAWGMDATLYSSKYNSTTDSYPATWIDWKPTTISAHNVSMNLEAQPGGLSQKLSLTANLPPLVDSYTGSLSLSAGIASLSLRSRMYRKTNYADFSFDPLTTTISAGRSGGPQLSDTFVYDGSTVGAVSNSTSFSWGSFFSSTISANRTLSYKPVIGSGWVVDKTKPEAFALTSLSLGLTPQWNNDASAKEASAAGTARSMTWSLKPTLSLNQSFVKFSESTLSFGLTTSVKIDDSFSLSFSSQSQNSSVWRYYAGLFESQLAGGGLSADYYRINPLADIWNSLSIWDKDSLYNGNFKLKSLSVKAVQDLHDWTLTVDVSTSPLYDTTLKSYKLNTSFSILLAWKDIEAIKTTVKKDSTGITY
jgi:lipopolysaccharide assembly outer membrane protein LptD (OstA)